MKMKDFLDMKTGTVVRIKRRRARLVGSPRVSGGWGSTNEYGMATFAYLDTGRQVSKHNRQVEVIPERKEMSREIKTLKSGNRVVVRYKGAFAYACVWSPDSTLQQIQHDMETGEAIFYPWNEANNQIDWESDLKPIHFKR